MNVNKLVELAEALGSAKMVLDSFKGCTPGPSTNRERLEWEMIYARRKDEFLGEFMRLYENRPVVA